jgi:hypothetical protein
MLCLPGTISRSPLGTLSTEVARADAKDEKSSNIQEDHFKRKEQTSI